VEVNETALQSTGLRDLGPSICSPSCKPGQQIGLYGLNLVEKMKNVSGSAWQKDVRFFNLGKPYHGRQDQSPNFVYTATIYYISGETYFKRAGEPPSCFHCKKCFLLREVVILKSDILFKQNSNSMYFLPVILDIKQKLF
jgi:hypothetical protein